MDGSQASAFFEDSITSYQRYHQIVLKVILSLATSFSPLNLSALLSEYVVSPERNLVPLLTFIYVSSWNFFLHGDGNVDPAFVKADS